MVGRGRGGVELLGVEHGAGGDEREALHGFAGGDTLGNVWEWCAGWYAPYPGGAAADYAGPATGTAKVSCGGSWWAGPRGARPANRYRDMPQNGNDDLGFRLALVSAR